MKLNIPYRKETIQLELPDSTDLTVLEPNDVGSFTTPDELIRNALESPVDSASFEDFMNAPGKLLVIVNDGTRPTPTRHVLKQIAPLLDKAGAEFIIATGVHRGPTQEEYDFIFGDCYDRFKDRIHVHDSRKEEEMVHIGVSKNGTEMYLNRIGWEADRVLVIGSVEPHYFAGYTGGRKGFLPGIAGYETIEQNHKHALDPRAKSLALVGNPVHEDMIDALRTLEGKNIFTVMTVLDKKHQIYAVTSGDINGAFYAAIDRAEEVFVAAVEEKADIVITCAKYPMDVDLYQSQKAIDNGKLALKDDGIMILVSSCRDGVGEEAFLNLLSSSDTPAAVLEKIRREFKLGYHKAGKMAEVFLWSSVWMYSDLDDQVVESIFMKPVADLQKAVEEALKIKGPDARVLLMPDGSVTVPSVK